MEMRFAMSNKKHSNELPNEKWDNFFSPEKETKFICFLKTIFDTKSY